MDRPVRDGDAAAVAAGEGDGTVRVLHVDAPAAVETAAAFLDRAADRIEVRDATSAEEALSRLERERVDCVVSGRDLPDADGVEFLRTVREAHGDLPLVLFTRGGNEELAREALAAGVTEYLPIRGADDGYELLAERVVEAVEDYRSRRATGVDGPGMGGRRRECVLASLHDATRELMGAQCEAAIADLAVRTARDVIGMPVTGCWLYDEDGHALVPAASTPESDALVGEPPTYHEGEGLSWEAYEAGETRVYADVSAQPERYNPETPVRSELVLPLGEHGVLNVGSPEADAFEDADVSLARVLAANTEAALDRADREQELRTQRELVDASLDALDDAFCVFDADGGLVRWNDSVVEATGYTDEELAGASLLEFLDPADRDRLPSVARELYRSGRARLEADVRTSDGERVPYEFTASSLAGSAENEADSGFVVVGRDVTDRRRRLRELERYEGIVEASGDPVYTLDAEGRFTFVNDALVDVVGHDEATLLGSHVSAVVPPADVKRVEAVIRSLLSADDDRATVELTVVTADGRRVPCETHVTLRPSDGGFRGTVGVVRDVSERIEHVRKLEALQERTGTLMHTRTRAETGRIAVDTAEEVLGVPLCGFNLLDEDGDALVPVATVDRVRETFAEPPTYRRGSGAETDRIVWGVFEAGEPRTIEDAHELDGLAAETPARNVILHPLGDHGVFVVSSTEPGAFDGTDTVLVEILATALTGALDRVERETLLREREEQLERQNERLEEFASVVSHDLRNPLNVAMGSLDLARETCDADELDAVANAHDRMESLIADLLALSRAGSDAAEDRPVELAGAVEGCWWNVETSDATLRVETDRVVMADEGLLKQVLENLVGNSVEHGSTCSRPEADDAVEHGSTSPRSRAREEGVEHGEADGDDGVTVTVGDLEDGFYVEDDGPGIPAEERERVFEAGYSTADDGTGFGLKIVADAARRQGWDVDVTEGTDGGARFEVTGVEFHGA